MSPRFAGKVVLLTGGAGGIGRAAALAFAREGAHVMIADYEPLGARDALAELQEVTDECAWVRADLRHEDQIARMCSETVRTFGRIDVLVNNAGAAGSLEPLEHVFAEEWDVSFAGNVRQAALCSKYALPEMLRGGGGAIVSTSSIYGVLGGTSSLVYGPAKAGIINLTRHLAFYYGPRNVRASCVCPGHTITFRSKEIFEQDRSLLPKYPIGRLGRTEDIVEAYLYLASEQAGFINGAVLMADGGFSVA